MPALRVVLVGDGPLRPRLEEEIERLKLGPIVTVHGPEPDARRLDPAFDLFVQASETEGLPNVVLEAAAASLPIVATDVGGTTEIVTDEETAILVPHRDPKALSQAIARVSEDPVLRDRLAQAARLRANDFAPERLVAATAAIYREVARRSASNDP